MALLLWVILLGGCLEEGEPVCPSPGQGDLLAAGEEVGNEHLALDPGVYPASGNATQPSVLVTLGDLPAESAGPGLRLGTHGVHLSRNETGPWIHVHVTAHPTDAVYDRPQTPYLIVNLTEGLDPGTYKVLACVDGDHGTRELPELPVVYRGQLDVER